MFEIRHEPGRVGLSDFTALKNVQVTIGGHPYEHLLYHYRLAYSGWQYARVIEGGESFVALSEGLQNALFLCGGAPQQHRTDSLSAAYHNLGGKPKPLTRLYDDLCAHYRLQPTRNNLGVAHENGSIESAHGHLKNRIEQAIYLRGSADFVSVGEYQALIEQVITRLNHPHQAKFEQEQACLQPLPKYRLPDYELLSVTVSCRSTIEVRRILYTVPSRLIGRRLEVRLYHNRLVGYFGTHPVLELPRVRVNDPQKRRGRCIDYRHVIEGLRRKPRAFLYCTWQADLLPNAEYQQLWQQLKVYFPVDDAARLMVEALYLAATQNQEAAVAQSLQQELAAGTLTLARLQQAFTFQPTADIPPLTVTQHNLSDYDQLIGSPPTDRESDPYQHLTLVLKQLSLTHLLDHWQNIEHQAMQQNWSYGQFLLELCQLEAQRREQLRLQRALSEAQLPVAKSFSNFDFSHCPAFNPTPLMQLAEDTTWLARAQNCILLGASGVGKTHLAA